MTAATAVATTITDDRQPVRPRRRVAGGTPRTLIYVAIVAGAVVMIYPLAWMIGASFKPESAIFSTSLNPFPSNLDFDNYVRGWAASGTTFGTFFLNSFLVCLGAIIGNLFACSLAAYAFARLNFRFRKVWFAVMLGTLMLPFHVTIVPQYVIFNWLGWTNSILPLVLPKFLAVEGFFVFLMVQFIRGIPIELEQAAMVDGASRRQVFLRIVLPLLSPALITTTIFTFIWTWNDFFSQLIYLNTQDKFTVALGLQSFLDSTGQSAWGPMFAMTTLSLIPVFLLFLFFQRRLVEGVATTGLK